MHDAFEELVERTRTFVEHLRSGRVDAGDFEALLLDRERILNQVPDGPADNRISQERFDELLLLDGELQHWCQEAQQALAHRLSQIKRSSPQSNDAGQLVLESA